MDYYILYISLSIIVLPAIIFGVYAQSKVYSTYNYAKTLQSAKGIAAKDFARRVLDAADMNYVKIIEVNGNLSDYYDAKNKVLALSHGNYNSSSLAALGIAAHELGHALQDKSNYKPLKIRHFFIKISNFFSRALFPLLLLSVLFSYFTTVWYATGWDFNSITYIPIFVVLGVYGLSCILNLVTLFVEYNASARTEQLLVDSNLLDEDEYDEVKRVLNAAALTYVASFVTSLFEIFRLLLIIFISRDRRE